MLRGRIGGELFGNAGKNDVNLGAIDDGKNPRDGQSVAAVVAFAAIDRDTMPMERAKALAHALHDAVSGILHQDQAGNAERDRAVIHLPHLGGRQNPHGLILSPATRT